MSQYSAHLQLVAGVLRVFVPGKAYCDPYVWCATVQRVDDRTVEFLGVMRAPTSAEREAIKAELARHGITRAVWERRKNGRRHRAEVSS